MPFDWGFDINRQDDGGALPVTEASLKTAVLLYSWASGPDGSDRLDDLAEAGNAVRTDDDHGRTGWRSTVTAGDLAPHPYVTLGAAAWPLSRDCGPRGTRPPSPDDLPSRRVAAHRERG